MKLKLFFAASILILANCASKNNDQSTTTETVENKDAVQRISLSERTRGTNRLFTITPNKIETDMNGNITSKTISSDNWKAISSKINLINLEEIQSFKSTTTKRYSDAALASAIKIEKDGKTYSSSEFDSGNPPQELRDLYLSIQNMVETNKGRK